MKKHALNPDDFQPRRRNSKAADAEDHARHVPVRDASARGPHAEPLSAYMVSPKYLPRDVINRNAPKRPLGQSKQVARPVSQRRQAAPRQPVKMYNQVATFGSMDRIRRPRMQAQHIPVMDEIPDRADKFNLLDRGEGLFAAAMATVGTAVIFVWDKAAAAGHYVVRKFQAINFGRAKVNYSAAAGAAYKRFGIRDNWLRISAPIVLLLFLLGMGLFASLHNGSDGTQPGGSSGGSSSNGSNGGTVLQVSPSSNHGSSGSRGSSGSSGNKGQSAGTATPAPKSSNNAGQGSTAANTAPSPGGSSSGAASGSSTVIPVGGRGGGSYSGPISVGSGAPTSSTGSNTITQAAPAPTYTSPTPAPTSTSGSTGGTSGGSGGTSLPLNPTTPLPTTITVPSTDVTAGGKKVVSTSPISGTLN